MTTFATDPAIETLDDLLHRLGRVPLHRIRLHPPPGTATEADVLVYPHGEKRLCELVDGVLVEKPMGYYESLLAGVLIQLLRNFLDERDLGWAAWSYRDQPALSSGGQLTEWGKLVVRRLASR